MLINEINRFLRKKLNVLYLVIPGVLALLALFVADRNELGLMAQILLPVSVVILCGVIFAFIQLYFISDSLDVPLMWEDRDRVEQDLGSLEVYLSYEILRPAGFGEILTSAENLYRLLYGLAQTDHPAEISSLSDFLAKTDALLKGNSQDQLRIETIHTGESIIFKLKSGWPSLKMENEDVVVSLPKGLGVVEIMTAILAHSVASGTTTVKEGLEAAKTYQELNLHDLQKEKLQLEIDELKRKATEAPQPIRVELDKELSKFIAATVGNGEIKKVSIKPGKTHRRDRGRH